MEGIASEIDLRWWLKNLMEQKRGEPKRRRGVCIRIPVGTATNTGGAQDVKGAGKVAFNIKKSRVKCVKRPSKKERKKESHRRRRLINDVLVKRSPAVEYRPIVVENLWKRRHSLKSWACFPSCPISK